MKAPVPHVSPLSTRLARLAPLDDAEKGMLQVAERDRRHWPVRRELVVEGEPTREARALLSGWACRQRISSDGRRQILSVLLPGDMIGMCQHSSPLAPTTVVAITEVTTCLVPAAQPGSGLAESYARSAALEQFHLLAQITRLGRMSAYERLGDWLLETKDRLALVDPSAADQFPFPLTQEMLADVLGLTSVHVNRMLQALRRDGLLSLQGGVVSFPDRARLEQLVWHKPARISLD